MPPEPNLPMPYPSCLKPLTENCSLMKEFRYPLNSWCIAFPAGLMEPEKAWRNASIESFEETGYALRTSGRSSSDLLPQAGFSSTG